MNFLEGKAASQGSETDEALAGPVAAVMLTTGAMVAELPKQDKGMAGGIDGGRLPKERHPSRRDSRRRYQAFAPPQGPPARIGRS